MAPVRQNLDVLRRLDQAIEGVRRFTVAAFVVAPDLDHRSCSCHCR